MLAPPQINYYLAELKQNGVKHSRQEFTARKILEQDLKDNEEAILQVLAALPDPPPPTPPAVPAPKPEPAPIVQPQPARSPEEIAATFRRLKGEDKPKPIALPASEDKPKAKRTGKYKAHRVARSKEQWRVLTNYPSYEISSYGRVRSLQRTGANDWLKPRWFRGAPSVVLYDKDGARRERLINWLMVAAGWLKQSNRKPAEELETMCGIPHTV